MRRTGLILGVLALAVSLAAPPGAAQTATVPDLIRRVDNPVFNSYIVTLKSSERRVPEAAGSLAASFGGSLSHVYSHALKGFSIRIPEEGARRLALNPRVASVEQDATVQVQATQSGPPAGLDRIDQRDLPLSGTYVHNATGAGVRAYIIDTGIRRTHQEFGGRALAGFDAFADGQNSNDCHGHGTHVAGTVGGSTYGVAKGVTLVAVRVLDCTGSGEYSKIIAGIDWVTAQNVLPAVANMSLGGGLSTALETAIRNSINSGITYAVAAGNDNKDACNYSPAHTPEALTVGASTTADARASFSNTGTCLDLFAPGVNTLSASYSSDTGSTTMSGTSMATPHVAGAAALYLEANSSASSASVSNALLNNSTLNKISGAGTGSANRLLFSDFAAAPPTPPSQPPPSSPPPPPPNVSPVAGFTGSCTGLTCSFTDTSTDSDGTIASRSWTFGDGGTSTSATASRTYSAPGTYLVKLTVTDDGGATAVKEQQFTVSSDPDTSVPNLSNGTALANKSGAVATMQYTKVNVPAGRFSLKIQLSAPQTCGTLCNPNLDLYVRLGAKPTTSSYKCRATARSSTESCTVYFPAAGWWYVGVRVASGTAALNYSVTPTF